jgi:hypothetical protein
LVGAETLNEEIDLAWWHGYRREVIDANLDAQAYLVMTQSGTTTDRKLMYSWLYGDVIHATAPRSPAIRDLDIDQRYYAAAPGIARICDRVIYTYLMLGSLIAKGLLTVDPEVLKGDVVVTTTSVDRAVRVRTSEVGVPIPSLGAQCFRGSFTEQLTILTGKPAKVNEPPTARNHRHCDRVRRVSGEFCLHPV